MSINVISSALKETEQAIAELRKRHDELLKMQPSSLSAKQSPTATFAKMIGQLDTIRAGLAVLEAHERAHPQHRSTQ